MQRRVSILDEGSPEVFHAGLKILMVAVVMEL
jgi:hypothetical protein